MTRAHTLRKYCIIGIALILAIATAIGVAGCHSGGAGSDDEASVPPPSVMMAVTAAQAIVAPMHRELRLLGTTVAMRHVQLRAPAAGRLLGFNLQIGDRVRRGEVVAQVLNREVEAAENGLAVARQLDPGEAAALTSSVRRNSNIGGVAVIAAADGIVAQRLASSGQLVNEMDPIAELIDPASVYVEAAAPIDDLGLIRPGMDATITSPLRPGAQFPARVVAIAPSVSANGATSPVRVEFAAGRLAEAGAPADVGITIASVPYAIVIPAAALFQDAADGTWHVFVAGADGRARRTQVTIGIRNATQVQVTAGIKAGDLVITSGGYALADGLKVSPTVTGTNGTGAYQANIEPR
jgi:multidrug efflux pump subunit AcrA (membrane-fusion protein)